MYALRLLFANSMTGIYDTESISIIMTLLLML